jgi:GTPase SAR1 family protein
MTNIKIMMLGATGVGKTSLMAALYNCSNTILAGTKLNLVPDLDTKKRLDLRLQKLKELSDNNCFKADGGDDQTASSILYTFNLSSKNSDKSSIQFTFQDYPGGDHDKKAEDVKNYLTECTAVLIAIDSSAMMEEKGRWHESINRPQQILELFKETYQDLQFPKLVIFAPVKCETYMGDKKSIDNLYSTTEAKYKELIEFLQSPSLSDKVDFAILPVQTVGSVIFSYIKEIEGEPQFFYRKRNSSDDYQPHGGEEVLRYLLKFILQYHVVQNSQIFILQWIQNMFNKDREFKEAIEKLALSSNTDRYSGMFEKELVKR